MSCLIQYKQIISINIVFETDFIEKKLRLPKKKWRNATGSYNEHAPCLSQIVSQIKHVESITAPYIIGHGTLPNKLIANWMMPIAIALSTIEKMSIEFKIIANYRIK